MVNTLFSYLWHGLDRQYPGNLVQPLSRGSSENFNFKAALSKQRNPRVKAGFYQWSFFSPFYSGGLRWILLLQILSTYFLSCFARFSDTVRYKPNASWEQKRLWILSKKIEHRKRRQTHLVKRGSFHLLKLTQDINKAE